MKKTVEGAQRVHLAALCLGSMLTARALDFHPLSPPDGATMNTSAGRTPYAGENVHPWSECPQMEDSSPFTHSGDFPRFSSFVSGSPGTLAATSNILSNLIWTSATNPRSLDVQNRSNGEQSVENTGFISVRGQVHQQGAGIQVNSAPKFSQVRESLIFSRSVWRDTGVKTRGRGPYQLSSTTSTLHGSGAGHGGDDRTGTAGPTLLNCAVTTGPAVVPRINGSSHARTVDGASWISCPDVAIWSGHVSGGVPCGESRINFSPVSPVNVAEHQTQWTGGTTAEGANSVRDLAFVRQIKNATINATGMVGRVPPPSGVSSWTEAAPALQGVSEAQGAAVGGRLYVFGGFNADLDATVTSQTYDLAADRWSSLPDMPEQVTHGAVAVDGATVYIAGGFVGPHPGPQTDHVWKYDTLARTWSAGPSLPGARGAGALVRLGRELHFFGGTERDLINRDVYLRDSPEHWVLNLDGGTVWTDAAPLPNPRNHLAGVALGGLVYAIGGQHLGDEVAGNQSGVQTYDPATGRWTARADMPRPTGHINASTLVENGRIMVVAGVTQKSLKIANVVEYDPGSDRWAERTPLPGERQSPVADAIGDQVVVTTGSLPTGVFTTTWVWGRR